MPLAYQSSRIVSSRLETSMQCGSGSPPSCVASATTTVHCAPWHPVLYGQRPLTRKPSSLRTAVPVGENTPRSAERRRRILRPAPGRGRRSRPRPWRCKWSRPRRSTDSRGRSPPGRGTACRSWPRRRRTSSAPSSGTRRPARARRGFRRAPAALSRPWPHVDEASGTRAAVRSTRSMARSCRERPQKSIRFSPGRPERVGRRRNSALTAWAQGGYY